MPFPSPPVPPPVPSGAEGPGHHHAVPAPLKAGPAPQPVPEALAMLEARRSLPLRALVEPGPAAADLERILAVAARVPDHGRLVPWRFIVIEGAGRRVAGDRLDALYGLRNPDLPDGKAHMWRDYLERAPVTVVAVSRADPAAKVPELNQVLSAGAACMNLVLAATALGYGALWLLKWPGRDPDAAALLGVRPGEKVAGFLHIGSPAACAQERPRPALADIVTRFEP